MSCVRGYIIYLWGPTKILQHSVGIPFVLLKMDLKKMFCRAKNKTEMSLVMGTFLSLHCEPWQLGWQICNLNWSLAVVQNAAEWTTGGEVEYPSLKDKVGSFSWSIIVLRCAFKKTYLTQPYSRAELWLSLSTNYTEGRKISVVVLSSSNLQMLIWSGEMRYSDGLFQIPACRKIDPRLTNSQRWMG